MSTQEKRIARNGKARIIFFMPINTAKGMP